MTDDPRQQLYEEYVTAIQEWEFAARAAQSYAVIKPLSDDLPPGSDQKTQQMREAFDRAEKAKKVYLEKQAAYMKYRKQHRHAH